MSLSNFTWSPLRCWDFLARPVCPNPPRNANSPPRTRDVRVGGLLAVAVAVAVAVLHSFSVFVFAVSSVIFAAFNHRKIEVFTNTFAKIN